MNPTKTEKKIDKTTNWVLIGITVFFAVYIILGLTSCSTTKVYSAKTCSRTVSGNMGNHGTWNW